MSYKKTINNLLAKDMNRREFLTHTGAAILTLVGVTGLLKTLSTSYGNHPQALGYGSSAYGGGKVSRRATTPRQLG